MCFCTSHFFGRHGNSIVGRAEARPSELTLLRAIFEGVGISVKSRERFAGEVEGAGD
jgi:hypothetical protein